MKRTEQRMLWMMVRMTGLHGLGGCVAWDEDFVDAFVEAFPEAQRSLRVYLLGANSSPMLNRAAAMARDRGFLSPGSIGSGERGGFACRSWARYWSITPAGWDYLKEHAPDAVENHYRIHPKG
jgi:hypothetical protein